MDQGRLAAALGEAASAFRFEHLAECGSTNTLLLERAAQGEASGLVLSAERQTAGRGRRGRSWLSAPGHSLTFSLLWRFGPDCKPEGLSLVVGLSAAKALEALGFEGIGLKWPNDIWLYGRKLGGVLIESRFGAEGFQAVIGIGLNLRTNPDWAGQIDQAFTALETEGEPPSQEILLGTLLRHLAPDLALFERDGFAAFQEDWNRRHALQSLPVRVSTERGALSGLCECAQADGALALRQADGALILVSGGDVSLSLNPTPEH